ncbi:DUF1510 family protein [Halobacillus yeomjeoni]|uniref:YrrS family protein n=1 Tax=Halobacillus yeomjeoni TaxID=311194 RepID=UPI001CD4F147|nr:YrrS family protein [Halobacillus yeomjeoni]MCA0982664.1 DUF1510 family protein [Halobacillus yeomjeoni]
MSNENERYSRSSRFEKKRRGTKLMSWLIGVGSIMLIVFISLMVFGGEDQPGKAVEPDGESKVEENTTVDDSEDESAQEDVDQTTNDENKSGNESTDKSNNDEETMTVEESSDENVIRIIKKDWEPVPTEQEIQGQHQIKYDDETQDWEEMLQAVTKATDLSKEEMYIWRIGRGNQPQQALATVSDSDKTNHYRVTLEWVDGEGYRPVQVEEMKEVDRYWEEDE